jgi:hypothetical protein
VRRHVSSHSFTSSYTTDSLETRKSKVRLAPQPLVQWPTPGPHRPTPGPHPIARCNGPSRAAHIHRDCRHLGCHTCVQCVTVTQLASSLQLRTQVGLLMDPSLHEHHWASVQLSTTHMLTAPSTRPYCNTAVLMADLVEAQPPWTNLCTAQHYPHAAPALACAAAASQQTLEHTRPPLHSRRLNIMRAVG